MSPSSDTCNVKDTSINRRTRAPKRRSIAVVFVLATLVMSGCGGSKHAAKGTTSTAPVTPGAAAIILRGARLDNGPWGHHVSVQLGRNGQPNQFYVCAVRTRVAPKKPCLAPPGSALPYQTILRLEQHPAGVGLKEPDSPGWGIVGTSDQADLRIVLSDFVSSSKPATITYRVTLRTLAGKKLATSNPISVTWHR